MNNEAWKRFGIVLSALWLFVTGFYVALVLVFGEASAAQALQIRLSCVLGYIVFGLGPVAGFTFLIKQRRDPLGAAALTVLAIFAATPVVVLLLYLQP